MERIACQAKPWNSFASASYGFDPSEPVWQLVDVSSEQVSAQDVLQEAIRRGLFNDAIPLVGFLDVDGIGRTVADLHEAFAEAPAILHAFAAKANPLVPVLHLLNELGMGCEVASPGELAVACAAEFPSERIVLDAPTKTRAELEHALDLGVAVNLDNLQEVGRVEAIISNKPSASVIGLRVNPQVGGGSIDAMSTATSHAKFGVATRDGNAREQIMETFETHPWLTRLHAHVGSQGCPLELIADGISATRDLARDINKTLGRQQVTSLDIGGGLPVNFDDDAVRPTFGDYVAQLKTTIPAIFDGEFSLITEFGRSILAKNGFMASAVEYTKVAGGRHIALAHVGAQVATRTVFMPEAWPLRISAYDSNGVARSGATVPHDIGGPLCFAGDVVAHGQPLPDLEPGDFIVFLDTGAYYFSSPWSYNNFPSPAVYGYSTDAKGQIKFALARPTQSLEEIVAFNSGALGGALTGEFA
jgi:diaminopimelate decarboxylase